jgi:hypothetical protein
MKRAHAIFITFISICLLLSATVFLAKPPSLQEAYQLQMATLLLNICGAVLFLLAIKGFKQALKVGYRFMSAGSLMLLAGVIEIYALQAIGASKQPWAGPVQEVPFILMAVFFYIGIRAFAKVIWAQSWLTKPKIVFPGAAILGLLMGFGPGLLGPGDLYEPIPTIRFIGLALFTCSLLLAYKVLTKTSPLYARAFTWFVAFFSLTVFNTFCGFLQDASWMGWFGQASVVLYLVAGVLLSITALQFNRVAYAEKAKPVKLDQAAAKSSVDIIVFLAGFASSQETTQPIMDRLRAVTAKIPTDGNPTPEQQVQLAGIYLSLEDYLVNIEPLRKFEQKTLREMIELQFKDAVNEPAFWEKVPVETMHS